MEVAGLIEGFSKLSREDQVKIVASFTDDAAGIIHELDAHLSLDATRQKIYHEFSENSVSNFFLPYSIAPNFRINDKYYLVPMVTEESSVVAAAASAAKYWSERGGFHTRVSTMLKPGHIHFTWKGSDQQITTFIKDLTPGFYEVTSYLTRRMNQRGGGIMEINLKDLTDKMEGYYQLEVIFDTADSMGANFINSCLEQMADFLHQQVQLAGLAGRLEIIMSVLSNYSPGCTVECSVNCSVSEMAHPQYNLGGTDFCRKFETAVNLAKHDVYRAVTHNKGIYNGVDAVVIATGNDFRAVEADGHAFASRSGKYCGLTDVDISKDSFNCRIEIPLTLGTVGGLTGLHPLASVSLKILGNPHASDLMSVVASAGIASNFSAIRALITGGIQKGHMKLHLSNVLSQFHASNTEKVAAMEYFSKRAVSFSAVEDFLNNLRIRLEK
jgi:hydroxymethylglutaryl-CoA reductase